MNDILRQIKKCDVEQPFIFVSYCSEDKEVVWRDVLEFQKRGYNVWLDEVCLDRKKESWKDDAIPMIKNLNSTLLLFYVSEHSLVSNPCLNEMRETRSEDTITFHDDNRLPFLAIEVEPIGNIIEFKKEVNKKIKTSGLTSDKCMEKIKTLSDFIKEFFNDNNEKVRIKSKKERPEYYYEDIIRDFPLETRIYECVKDVVDGSVVKNDTKIAQKIEENRPLEKKIEVKSTQEVDEIETQEVQNLTDTDTVDDNKNDFVYFQGATAEIIDGKYIVKKDSIINKSTSDSCPESSKRIRNEAIENGELVEENGSYRLLTDKTFKSASGAAGFVAGFAVSGAVAWKNQPSAKKVHKSKVEINKDGKASKNFLVAGMEVYVKKHESEIGVITEAGLVSFKGREVSLNQFVQLVLGPGSRNAYLYIFEKVTKKSLAELREEASKAETESTEKAVKKIEVKEVEIDCVGSEVTIGEVRAAFSDALKAFDFRPVREGMPRGGKGAMDYVMATVLGGCNQITEASPRYQINYYTYDVATQDASKKKEDGKLGATWTWSSNCRKVLNIEGAGSIPKEINTYFHDLPESTTLGQIEQWFKEGQIEAFQTKKNDVVLLAVQQLIAFMEK